jgi:uncharacterized protein (DUF433 family)
MNYAWTIREAAAIADIPAKTIRQMIEREGLKPDAAIGVAQKGALLLSLRDLILVKLLADFPFSLEKAHKAAIEALLRGRRPAGFNWQAEGQELLLRSGSISMRVDCAPLREMLTRNSAAFLWGQRRIASDFAVLNGEPVFRGTSISLARVEASIRKGAADCELMKEFPGLSQTDLDYARIHARMGKRPGRPRKPRKPIEVRRAAEAA